MVEVEKETTYTISASSGTSLLSATIHIKVNSNVCSAENGSRALFAGQGISENCDFLGTKSVECKIETDSMTVALETDDSQCTTMILVFVIVIVVVVLVVVIAVLVLITRFVLVNGIHSSARGGIRYDQKKAQRKMAELAYV